MPLRRTLPGPGLGPGLVSGASAARGRAVDRAARATYDQPPAGGVLMGGNIDMPLPLALVQYGPAAQEPLSQFLL